MAFAGGLNPLRAERGCKRIALKILRYFRDFNSVCQRLGGSATVTSSVSVPTMPMSW